MSVAHCWLFDGSMSVAQCRLFNVDGSMSVAHYRLFNVDGSLSVVQC